MQNDSTSNLVEVVSSPDGVRIGQASTDKVSFYGASPVVQPSGAAQTAITDSSGGSADPATGVAALTATYNSTIIADALATIIAQTNKMRSDLVSLGLIAGS